MERLLKVSQEKAMEIEKETRVQAASSTWFTQRAGRITASNKKTAKQMYRKSSGNYIHDIGLVINPFGRVGVQHPMQNVVRIL